jgi:hypothetical protein
MEGIELILHPPSTGVLRGAFLRVCRVEQVKQLFRLIEEVVARHALSQVIISLDRISLLRSEVIRQAFIQALSARSAARSMPLVWAGGSAGDAAFIRSASAVARVSLQRFETEHEALMVLQLTRSQAPEVV